MIKLTIALLFVFSTGAYADDYDYAKKEILETMSSELRTEPLCKTMDFYSKKLKYCLFENTDIMNAVFLRPGMFITSKFKKIFIGEEIFPHLLLSNAIQGHNYSRQEILEYNKLFQEKIEHHKVTYKTPDIAEDIYDQLKMQVAVNFYSNESKYSNKILNDNSDYDYLITLNKQDKNLEKSLSHELLHAYFYVYNPQLLMSSINDFYKNSISKEDKKTFENMLDKQGYNTKDSTVLYYELFSYLLEEDTNYSKGFISS